IKRERGDMDDIDYEKLDWMGDEEIDGREGTMQDDMEREADSQYF
ncbi:14160_t:CDS:1, partial [Acaulospora colombiana]